jgi:FkbM family methyltransferase
MTTAIHQSSNLLLQKIQRRWLDFWGMIGIAPGWHYAAFEKFGERLSNRWMCRAVLPNDCSLMCDLRDHVQRQIYFLGTYEPIEAYLFCHLIKPGMTIVDAGSNIGQYSLLASTSVGETGSVHSFEPIPAIFSQLSENVKSNRLSNVYLNQAGLWHSSMSIQLSLAPEMAQNCGAYSIGSSNDVTAVDAIAIALDEYVEQHQVKQVDLIKMDIEGAEYSALLGMQKTILRDRPVFLMEINRSALEKLDCNPERLWRLLVESFGYTAYRVGLESCELIDSFTDIVQGNVILTHPSNPVDLVQTCWSFKDILRWGRRCKRSLSVLR